MQGRCSGPFIMTGTIRTQPRYCWSNGHYNSATKYLTNVQTGGTLEKPKRQEIQLSDSI